MLDCGFGPDELIRTVLCLDDVSKVVEGEILAFGAQPEECRERDCRSLVALNPIVAELKAFGCDSQLSTNLLDGRLVIDRLTTVFGQNGVDGRGVHAGEFVLRGNGTVVDGTIQGMTNVGIMHEPLRNPVEDCFVPGVMIGRLCGRVRRCRRDPGLECTLLTGIYRFEFDQGGDGGLGRLRGVFEGALLPECGEPPC